MRRTPIQYWRTMPATAPVEPETFEPEVLLYDLSQVKGGDFTARMPVH